MAPAIPLYASSDRSMRKLLNTVARGCDEAIAPTTPALTAGAISEGNGDTDMHSPYQKAC